MTIMLREALQRVFRHDGYSDEQKKEFIEKAFAYIGSQNLSFEEVSQIFDFCLHTALENYSNKLVLLSLYIHTALANKYPEYLKQYLTIGIITEALEEDDVSKLKIVFKWLKESLQVLSSRDPDYVLNICPMLTNILERKFVDNGRNSALLSQISELYLLCPSLLPVQNMRLKFTLDIMHCVASFPTPTKPEILKHMKNIGELINMLWETLQLEDLLKTLMQMYTLISNTDPSVEVCPAMAHILSLVFPQVVERLGPRLVSEPQHSNESFEATLIRLCNWLITWPPARDTLVHWIRTLVRLLYQSGRNIVPAKITYDQISKLLEGLRIPVCRPGVLSVTSLLLLSFQCSPIVFHKIIGNIITMINCLENEDSQSAKDTRLGLVKLCHAQMSMYPGHPETYQNLMNVLEKYKTPSDDEIQTLIQDHTWVTTIVEGSRLMTSSKSLNKLLGSSAYSMDSSVLSYHKRGPGQKVGLRNLGNTCYMNSVIQALFMTDDFRHSVLHTHPKSNQQLLVKLQHLFTSLCFSHRSYISPKTFHDTSRPPWFSPGMQHDCSEYLRHLMITLHEEERAGQKLPEYQERMIIESETTSLASDLQPLPDDNYQTQLPDPSTLEDQDSEMKLSCKIEEDKKAFKDDNNQSLSSGSLDSPKGESSFVCDRCETCLDSVAQMEEDTEHECKSFKMDINKENNCNNDNSNNNNNNNGDNNNTNSKEGDRDSGSSFESMKRKYNVSPADLQLPRSKSPKGESSTMTSETDNSSDSGISGDLAEELDYQHTHKSDGSLPEKNLYIQEVNHGLDSDYFVSQVHKIFGGKISTSIKCLNCKTESIHKDVFTDINLAFQDSDQNNAASTIRKQPERLCKQKQGENVADLKIEDMIANFLNSETLTGENQYECDRCGGKQDAERSLRILETPEHLILTQLRFYYDTSKGQRQKVFTNVDFKEELLFPNNQKVIIEEIPSTNTDITGTCLSSSSEESKEQYVPVPVPTPSLTAYDRYALYGVVVHSGFSSEGGHYYCYGRSSSLAGLPQSAKEKYDDLGEWFNFNDERVTKTTFCAISRLTRTFTRDTAYLLFYRKMDITYRPEDSKVPLLEDFSSLRQELQDLIESENLQYQNEQEHEQLRRRVGRQHYSSSSFRKTEEDEDPPPPPPSSGGTCGDGNGLSITSREVF